MGRLNMSWPSVPRLLSHGRKRKQCGTWNNLTLRLVSRTLTLSTLFKDAVESHSVNGKRVANCEGGMLGDRKTIGISKLRTNVATCVALHLGVIFKPENEAFFELATERLLERDKKAVKAGLTLPQSNGMVEGKVNKLKRIKRMMYGWAAFPLLRQCVLHAL